MREIFTGKCMRRTGAFVFVFLMSMMLAAPAAFALSEAEDDTDMMVPSRQTDYFNVDVQVNENNTYDYTETVGFVFNTPGHGIYRYVPTIFDGIQEKVSDGWCDTNNMEDYYDGDNYVLQMGDAERYLNGRHEFKYGYTVKMKDDRNTDSDYMYIDVLPVDWETPVAKSEITIHMPKKISKEAVNVYGGSYSSTSLPDNITWSMKDNRTIKIQGDDLEKGEGVTVLVDLPEGYWTGAWTTAGNKTAFIIICLLFVAAFALIWFKFGRKQDIVKTVEFNPPEGVTPAEIGLIIDGRLDKKDMVSMFMYFAQKGLMNIKMREKKGFLFTKLDEIRGEKRFAEVLFNGTFGDDAVIGTKVTASNLGTKFAESYLAACDIVEDDFGTARDKRSVWFQRIAGWTLYIFAILAVVLGARYMLRENDAIYGSFVTGLACAFITAKLRKHYKSRMSNKGGKKLPMIIYWAVDALLLIATTVGISEAFESAPVGILFFISFGLCQILNVYYERYSENAVKYLGKILGLREFIKTAELDKLNELVEANPNYYFDILPYAYVMGLTDKWAKKFESIPINVPAWYEGMDGTNTMMNSMYMANAMNGLNTAAIHAVGNSMPHIKISGGGGSDHGGGWLSGGGGGGFSGGGGGGFSGGGAGGGGGGSW